MPAVPEVRLPRLEVKVPQELGTVKEEYWNHGSAAMLVHIQDAHGNYEAQNQIKNLIAHLEKAYGFSALFLEGSDAEIDPSIYHFFKEPALNLQLSDALLKEGELSGAEMHLIEQMESRSKRISAYGIEKTEFYKNDLQLFKKVYAQESSASEFLINIQKRFEILTGKLLSAPLRKTVRAWQGFADSGELVRYVAFLDGQARKFLNLNLHDPEKQKKFPQIIRLVRLKEIEPQINRDGVEKEKQKLVALLRSFKEGIPFAEKLESLIAGQPLSRPQERGELPRYFFEALYDAAAPHGLAFRDYPSISLLGQYLVLQSEMDSEALFEEIERLSDDLFSALAKTDPEREFVHLMKDLALLKKLFKLELTRKDYKKVSGDSKDLKPSVIERRLAVIRPLRYAQGQNDMDELFGQALEFYRLAERREESFLENIIRRMKEGGSEKAILVTGGFHSQGMAEKFRERGISFISVQPRISSLEQAASANYLSAMLASKKTIFDQSQISKVLTALGGSGVAARLAEISGDPDYPAYVAKQIVEKALRLAPDAVSLLAAEDFSISRLVKLNFSVSLRDQDQLIVSMSFPGSKTGRPQVRRFSLELSRLRPDASKFLSGLAQAASLGGKKDKGHRKRQMEKGRREKNEPAGRMFSRRQWLVAGGLLGLGAITWGVISSISDDGGKMDRAKALAETRVLLGELIKELNGQGDPLGPYAEKLLVSMKEKDPFVGLRVGLMGVLRDPQAKTIAFVLNEEAWIPLLEEAGRDKRYREFLKMSLYKEASQWQVAEKDYAPQIQSSEDHVRREIMKVNDEVMRLTRTKEGDRVGVVPDETLVRFYKIAFAIRMHEEYLGFFDALEYSKRHGFVRQPDPGRLDLLDDSPIRALRDRALEEGKKNLAGKMGTHLHLLGHIAMAGRTGFSGRKAVERGIKISGSILLFMRNMDDWLSEDSFFYQTLDSLLQIEEKAGRAELDLTARRIKISNLPNGDILPAFLEFLTDENYYDPQKIGTLPVLDFGKIFVPSQGKGSSLGEEFPDYPYWTNMQRRLARLRDRGFIDAAFYDRLFQYHAIHEKDVSIKPFGGPKVVFRANRIQHTLFPGRPAKGGIRVIYADEFARDKNFMKALDELRAQGATVEQANEFLHHWIRQMTMALALEMSFKTAVMDLPLGGAKSVIPLFEIVEKDGKFVPECVFKDASGSRPSGVELALAARAIARYFAEEGIVGFDIDIPAPDRNTNPQFMAWMLDEHLKVLAELEKKGIETSLHNKPGLIRELQMVKRTHGLQILDPIKTPFANYAAGYAVGNRFKLPELATYTGKSIELGGQVIRDQATGLGVLILAKLLAEQGVWKGETDMLRGDTRNPLQGIRAAFQGFGNVGQNGAILFAKHGVQVVAVSDETKGIYTTSHYTWQALANLANYVNPQIDRPRRFLRDVPFGEIGIPVTLQYEPDDYLTDMQPVDILIPAAVENAITQDNADKITARVILPAANGAVTIEAEEMLWNRVNPVFVLPDILTSAGGVTMSYREMLEGIGAPPWKGKKSQSWLSQKFKASFDALWQRLDRLNHIDFGLAADIVASERIKKAMEHTASSLGRPDRAVGRGLIESILEGNLETLEEAWKKAGLPPWDIQLAGRNLIHLLPLPQRTKNAHPRSEAIKQFQTYASRGIFIADESATRGLSEPAWETHFNPDFGFFISRKLWDSLADKRELVKVIVRNMLPAMSARIANVPLNALASGHQARPAPHYLTATYQQMEFVINKISQESAVDAGAVLDVIDLLRHTPLTRPLLDLLVSKLNEFYDEVETAMNKDFHKSKLKHEMGNADEPLRFKSIMSHIRSFAARWGVVYDRDIKRSLRYLSNAFFIEKSFLRSWLEMLEMYIHPERDEILRRKFVEANLAFDLKELAAEYQAKKVKVPAALMAQMRRSAEKNIPADNTDSYFNIKVRRILDEEPPKILQRIKDRYRHWILHFFHHGGVKESEWTPQLEDTVQVFAQKTEALVRELRPLIKRIPKIAFVPEPEEAESVKGSSLGQNVIVSFKRGEITASYKDVPLLEETPAGEREFPHELRRFIYKGPDALDVRKMLLNHPRFRFDPNVSADSTKNRLQTNWWPGPLENHVGIQGSWDSGVVVAAPQAATGKSIKLAQYFFRYEPDSKTIIFNYLGELWQDERVRGSGFFVKLLRRMLVENPQAEKLVVQELPAQVIEDLPETSVPRMSPGMMRGFFAPIVEAFGFLQWEKTDIQDENTLLAFRIVRARLSSRRELPAAGSSLGAAAKLYFENRGYGTQNSLTAEIVTRDVTGNIIDRFLIEAEPAVFKYLFARLFSPQNPVFKEQSVAAFNSDIKPALRYLGIRLSEKGSPLILEEGLTGNVMDEKQAKRIIQVAGRGGAAILLGENPSLRRYLDQYASSEGILVKYFPLQTVNSAALNQVLKDYALPALALSTRDEPLILEFNGEKIKLDRKLFDQHGIDPLQALALFKQIIDNPVEKRKGLFFKAGLDFDQSGGYWTVSERFITSFLKSVYSAEEARKTLAQAA